MSSLSSRALRHIACPLPVARPVPPSFLRQSDRDSRAPTLQQAGGPKDSRGRSEASAGQEVAIVELYGENGAQRERQPVEQQEGQDQPRNAVTGALPWDQPQGANHEERGEQGPRQTYIALIVDEE